MNEEGEPGKIISLGIYLIPASKLTIAASREDLDL